MTSLCVLIFAFPELFLAPSSLSGPLEPYSVLYRFHHPSAATSGWAMAYGRPYSVPGLHYLALGWGTRNWMLGAEDLGDPDFGESTIYISMRFSSLFTPAITLRMSSLRGADTPWWAALDGGFTLQTKDAILAFTARQMLGTEKGPASALLSLAWRAFPDLNSFLDFQLVSGRKPSLLTGVTLAVLDQVLYISTGMAASPARYFSTLRLTAGSFHFAYTLSYHTYLGSSHSVEVAKTVGHR